jgi:aspartate racemase
MKTCGIIGGMSWESSLIYYKLINEEINKKLGGLSSGKIILNSLNFEEIALLQKEGNWDKSGKILSNAAIGLQKAGADFVIISTNTMHKVAHFVRQNISIPLVDIRDTVIEAVKKDNINEVLLLGTKFTMEDDFYKTYLQKAGLNVFIPEKEDREFIHKVIFEELCLGVVKKESKNKFIEIIENSEAKGVILGCTEIGMLINAEDTDKKVYDTTELHAKKAVDLMI